MHDVEARIAGVHPQVRTPFMGGCGERPRASRSPLEAAQLTLRAVWDETPVGMAICALDGRILEVNDALSDMLDVDADDLVGQELDDLGNPDDVEEQLPLPLRAPVELTRRWQSGTGRDVHAQVRISPIWSATGHPVGHLAVAQDCTEHVVARATLAHAALHDDLTGLPNRRGFLDTLQHHLRRSPESGPAVVLVDLDHFNTVNDGAGHTVGDRLLVVASQRLRACAAPDVPMARYGGDEFTFIVPGPDALLRARALAAAIHADLRHPLKLGERELYCTASIGIADAPAFCGDGPTGTADVLVRNADIALHKAKHGGRDRTVEFSDAMSARLIEALDLQTDLHQALCRRELRLHYQPIVDLLTGRAAGFEALLRWQHPRRGLLRPGAFLHVIDDNGLAPLVARFAIPEACAAAARLGVGPKGPYVTVNMSMRQLADPGLLEVVDHSLNRTGLPASRLRIEVTESVVAEDLTEVVHVLDALRRRGLGIYMDDFGTGVSSYARLNRLPLDALKIDRAFITPMGEGPRGRSLVHSILTLSNSLGMPAIAEGVETEAQRQALLELGFRWAQGYLFGRPMPLSAARRVPLA